MAKFSFDLGYTANEKTQSIGSTYGGLFGRDEAKVLSVDDLLEVLRPAAIFLRDCYKEAIRSMFRQRTGSLAESIDFEENYYIGSVTYGNDASFIVKPFGKHKGGMYERRSRAGSPTAKYAKHNRHTTKKQLKNEELAYFLEFGTPRIKASHWMESTNERVESQVQDIIDDGFTELLKKKGLI